MLTITEAFQKFRSKLELTQKEQADASRRQKDVRAYMDECFHIERDFLTGSYKRWTKTKPLKDVDIFCVLGEDERKYRSKHPSVLLGEVDKKLAKEYGRSNVSLQRRSVSVNFGVAGQEERVMSFDVVPAFDKRQHFEIPDTQTKMGWTETDPEIHAERAKFVEPQRLLSRRLFRNGGRIAETIRGGSLAYFVAHGPLPNLCENS